MFSFKQKKKIIALSEVSRVLLSFGVDGVLENRVLLETLHRQVHEDFRKESPGEMEFKSQKED